MTYKYTEWVLFKDGSFQKRTTYWKAVKFGNHHEVTMARLVPVQNGNQFIEMIEE